MAWEIEGTDQFADWFAALGDDDRAAAVAAVDALMEAGPALGRPFVDTIKGSRHAHMKELRPMAGNLRVLFCLRPAPHRDPAARRRQDWSLASVVRRSDPPCRRSLR